MPSSIIKKSIVIAIGNINQAVAVGGVQNYKWFKVLSKPATAVLQFSTSSDADSEFFVLDLNGRFESTRKDPYTGLQIKTTVAGTVVIQYSLDDKIIQDPQGVTGGGSISAQVEGLSADGATAAGRNPVLIGAKYALPNTIVDLQTADDGKSLAVGYFDYLSSNTLGTGGSVTYTTEACATLAIQVGTPAGAWTGAIIAQATVGNSLAPIAVPIYDVNGRQLPITGIVANGLYFLDTEGFQQVTLSGVTSVNVASLEAQLSRIPKPLKDAYSPITARFNAAVAAATEQTVLAGVAGKTIYVLGYSISTDSAMNLNLHHQAAAAAANSIGGGYFPAFGGERADFPRAVPGLAVNQPVNLLSSAVGNADVTLIYYLV